MIVTSQWASFAQNSSKYQPKVVLGARHGYDPDDGSGSGYDYYYGYEYESVEYEYSSRIRVVSCELHPTVAEKNWRMWGTTTCQGMQDGSTPQAAAKLPPSLVPHTSHRQ